MSRSRVLIAGGGIAGAEALLALRDLAGDRAEIELITPSEELVYRPQLVAEPFGLATAARVDLRRMAREQDAAFRRDALAAVDPAARSIRTAAGETVSYDALLIATGVRHVAAVEGAITFGDAAAGEAVRALLRQLEARGRGRVVFAVPAEASWSLPAYELALLTSSFLRARAAAGAEIAVVTHERRPLELLGERAPEIVAELLDRAGIELRAGAAPVRFDGHRVVLADGVSVPADHAVALPAPRVPAIRGIPQRSGGFVPTDAGLNVEGLTHVWAAGDATWFPVKQGGLAAQQADVAAQAIAASAGARVPVAAYRPVLRAALLTGTLPRYFRSALFAGEQAAASPEPLWSPPAKLAGRYLTPWLSAAGLLGRVEGELVDLEPDTPAETREPRRAEVDFAFAAAEADAGAGDFDGALTWLRLAEELSLVLPPEWADRRRAWGRQRRGASGVSHHASTN